MSAVVSVNLPASHVAVLAEEAATLHGVKAEALHLAAAAYLADPPAGDPAAGQAVRWLREDRRELAAVEDILEQLRSAVRQSAGAIELTGPPGVVRELLFGSLTDVAEKAAEACLAYERGALDLRSLEGAVPPLVTAFELFVGFERRDGDGS